jgi:hypothetical protein
LVEVGKGKENKGKKEIDKLKKSGHPKSGRWF